ncbi:MAG: HD domain-containing protein [Candidatus Diapherotrites archaeon]|nr:HD domain-containing protein [Candidatus Diapherotrites archaeon]
MPELRAKGRKLSSQGAFRFALESSGVGRAKKAYLNVLRSVLPRQALLLALKAKHPAMYRHSREVASLSVAICREYAARFGGKFNETAVREAALFHDIGKLGIGKGLMAKRGLSADELRQFRQHPQTGFELTESVLGRKAREAILLHQEEIDGSGYPLRLKGPKLNLLTRILTVADDYSAMTQRRGYNNEKSPAVALKDLVAKAGKRYDRKVVEAFATVLRKQGVVA